MKLFTIDEIVSSILEETEGLDEEITDGMILSNKEISPSEIEKLKSKLKICLLYTSPSPRDTR